MKGPINRVANNEFKNLRENMRMTYDPKGYGKRDAFQRQSPTRRAAKHVKFVNNKATKIETHSAIRD